MASAELVTPQKQASEAQPREEEELSPKARVRRQLTIAGSGVVLLTAVGVAARVFGETLSQRLSLDSDKTVETVFNGTNPFYEMVVRVKVDPDYTQLDTPIAQLADRGMVRQIIENYIRNIGGNESELSKLFADFEPARVTLNSIVRTIFTPADFKSKRYPYFSAEWIKRNTVFVDSSNPVAGGGHSAILDRRLPGTIIGPYGIDHWFNKGLVWRAFVSNVAHEIVGHPIQSLIDNSGISEEEQERMFPIVHTFMGVTVEDPARLAVGIIDGRPSGRAIQAMKIMEDGGMSPKEVVRIAARIGGGKMSDIYLAENAYKKGRGLHQDTYSFFDLMVHGQLPTEVATVDDLNHFRKCWAKMFGVRYWPYFGNLFTPDELQEGGKL